METVTKMLLSLDQNPPLASSWHKNPPAAVNVMIRCLLRTDQQRVLLRKKNPLEASSCQGLENSHTGGTT